MARRPPFTLVSVVARGLGAGLAFADEGGFGAGVGAEGAGAGVEGVGLGVGFGAGAGVGFGAGVGAGAGFAGSLGSGGAGTMAPGPTEPCWSSMGTSSGVAVDATKTASPMVPTSMAVEGDTTLAPTCCQDARSSTDASKTRAIWLPASARATYSLSPPRVREAV